MTRIAIKVCGAVHFAIRCASDLPGDIIDTPP
jgi:hypothetical protein